MKRRLAVSFVVVIPSLALCGCDPIGTDDIAVRIVDGGLAIAVCESVAVSEVVVRERPLVGDWTTVWDARGDVVLSEGDVVDASTIDAFDEVEVFRDPDASGLRGITVSLRGADDLRDGLFAAFDFFPGTLGDEWVHPDGRRSNDPC